MTSTAIAPVKDWLAEAQRLVAERGSGSLHDVVLHVAVRRLGASGGAIWHAANGEISVVAQVGFGSDRIDLLHQRWPGHSDLLQRVGREGRPEIIEARLDRPSAVDSSAQSQSVPLVLAVAPFLRDEDEGARLLELFLTTGNGAPVRDDALNSLAEYCRGIAELEVPGEAAAQGPLQELETFSAYCGAVHGNLDLQAAADSIVNQTRAWLRCSRVSLLRRRGRRCRLVAISDYEDFDRRSEAVRSLERMAAQVVRDGLPQLQCGRSAPSAAHSTEEERSAWDDERPWLLGIVPLSSSTEPSSPPTGVLIVEDFDEAAEWTDERQFRLQLAADQAGAAFAKVLRQEGVPLHRLGRTLQILGWRSVATRTLKLFVGIALVAALVAALVLVKTDFDISGRATLRPATERDVFAGIDAIVDQLQAEHGTRVAANDVLIRLRSPRLMQERVELEGQRRTTEQQIADLSALRGDRDQRGEGRPVNQAELAARHEELNSLLESLDSQLAALSRHEQELAVHSPIAGRVLTWNIEQLLTGRPVLAGQRLMTVADLDGPWIAEVLVPDRDIGHVEAAQQDGQPVRVSLLAATDLSTRRTGTVQEIAQAVTHDPLEGPVVVVTVAVDPQPGIEPRPGATVYPRIHCGRRSLGYVWFRRFYETVASWLAL
jgi:hypothetical protein